MIHSAVSAAARRRFLPLLGLLALVVTPYTGATVTSEDARAVARLYSAAFDREPAGEGLNFWIRSLERGQTLLQLAQKFRDSPEFSARYGALDAAAFVRQLYRNVLGREGAPSGVEFWVGNLQSGQSQAFVLRQFSESPENRHKTDDLFAEMHRGTDDLWTYEPFNGPVVSAGTIDGFGSIFVNGIEFETESAAVFIDGQPASDDALRLGMVVTVNGVINGDGTTGSASRVVFDDEVQGPVSTLVPGQDGDTLTLTVLGVEVIAERTGTVFEDTSFSTLTVGDLVEVSGFADDQGRLRATRIEKKNLQVAGGFEVELKGVVSGPAGTVFNLGQYTVDFSGADLTGVPGGVPLEGMIIEVHGTLADGTITAQRVEQEDGLAARFERRDEVHVEGSITGFTSSSRFEIGGLTIDGSGALLRPADLVLSDGAIVQVEGNWDGNVLVARKIESRRGRVEIEASVASVDDAAGTVTLQLAGGTVTVRVDSRTMLEDSTRQADPLSLADLAAGNFLEVEAIRSGNVLLATRVDRDDSDDVVIQAPVTAFNPGVDITLLGITFTIGGTQFESESGSTLTSSGFFDQLSIGDLVKIKDERPADGVADEVEFEREDALDGDECETDDRCHRSGGDDDDDDDSGDDSGHGGGSDDGPGDDSGGDDNSGKGGGSDD